MTTSAATAKPSAAKRGRNSRFPYVPIVKHTQVEGYAVPREWTTQCRGFAFATREEAIAYARRYIDANWACPTHTKTES